MDKVLVIGSGAREHALCWKLSKSTEVKEIYCAPGSDGISLVPKAECVSLNIHNFEEVGSWAKAYNISLAVIGPEDPLANGIVDSLESCGIKCFGPKAAAARIESEKAFAKEFMVRQGIPTAKFAIFTDAEKAKNFIRTADFQALVVKASGTAAGKGVIVAKDVAEACAAVDSMLIAKDLGDAGSCVVIEELLEGEEVSVLAFSDGTNVLVMLPAQDHKRIFDGDEGGNTGGMGAYAPCLIVDSNQFRWIEKHVIQKAIDGLRDEGTPFIGCLFAGIMMTRNGPKVLEYNCRFGDPETEVLMPLLESDLYSIMKASISGTLNTLQLKWKLNTFAVGVVMASKGYPKSSSKGDVITGLDDVPKSPTMIVFHAGTARKDGVWVTNGGRVLISVCLSGSLVIAASKATNTCQSIAIPGGQFRKDIAHKGISRWIHSSGRLSYKDSGVDIAAGNDLVDSIKPLVNETNRPGVLTGLGGFGAFFDLSKAGYKDPLLLSGTDGIGTKLKVAQACGIYSTIGIDLVAMCVNDILCHGAEPLFFLDYFACGQLDVKIAKEIIAGVAEGCQLAGCALVGGETAEMPGLYSSGDFDLAGFAVGAVERGHQMPFMERIQAGDLVIGLLSSGLHSNGFSLARKIIENQRYSLTDKCPFDDWTFGEELLAPTLIYVKEVLPLLRAGHVKAVAHITGGGLIENVPRVLPDKYRVTLDASKWGLPTIFSWLCAAGGVSHNEMLRTFNCGIGMVLIVSRDKKCTVLDALKDRRVIGEVQIRTQGEPQVNVINMVDTLTYAVSRHIKHLMERARVTRRIGVLISGTGTNLQAIIDDIIKGNINGEIVTVISNISTAEGLNKAKKAGIQTKVISHKGYTTREDFEKDIHKHLVENQVELVVLAGFMRILTGWFVRQWRGKLINIHPALLPSFKGVNAWQQALDAGVRLSGCTVHFVEEEVDGGGIIAQEVVPISVGETVETLKNKIGTVERKALPKAIQLLCSGMCRLDLEENKVVWKN